jgi:Mor family transcriptional regulator
VARNQPKFDDDQAKEIRKKYEAGRTVEGLGKEYHTSASTICRTIRRVGGDIRTQNYKTHKFDDETAKQMRQEYEDGATLYDLVDKYGTFPTTIANNIKRVGGKMRSHNSNKGRPLGRRKPKTGILSWVYS